MIGKGKAIFLPWKRAESVEHWFELSAKRGNPKAMMQLFGIYREKGELEKARYWLEQAARTGYEAGVFNYGYFLAFDPDALGFKKNTIKGYALISRLRELDGGGAVKADVEETLPQIAADTTLSDIEQAASIAKEWKNNHPPISFFPEKLEF